MDADRYQRIKLIFQAVREAPEVNRRDILEARCAGDLELREAVLKLLKSDGEAGGFLEPTERNEGDLEAILPAQIGPYRIDKRIGAGGMGVVFLATEPEPTRRKVAIKLIRSDLHDSGSMKRFETEQRALALMDHPGIANIFHAGVTAEGRPFFVMEYVQGVQITDYCNREKQGTRARMELFLHVCDAVQHAHDQGVIHRDLKPSNILVKEDRGAALPKIIDFGIAKAIGPRLTSATHRTQQGAIIGTPGYMSPEQADPLGPGVRAASDVYSLGVILYELVTGLLPFQQGGPDQEAIRFNFPLPSERLESLPPAVLRELLSERGTDRRRLSQQLSGLDALIRRALQVNPQDRYATVMELGDDLRRHLRGKRVGSDRRLRMPRTLIATTASILLVMAAGVAALIWLPLAGGDAPWSREPLSLQAIAEQHGWTSLEEARKQHRLLSLTKDDVQHVAVCPDGSVDTCTLMTLGSTGLLRSRAIPPDPTLFHELDRESSKKGPRLLDMRVAEFDGRPAGGEVVLAVSHQSLFPTHVFAYSEDQPSDARPLLDYWNMGWAFVEVLGDLNADGRDEIAVYGTDNNRRAAILTILVPGKEGANPGRSPDGPRDITPASLKTYPTRGLSFSFPKSVLARPEMEQRWRSKSDVKSVSCIDGVLEVLVFDGVEKESGQAYRLLFRLDPVVAGTWSVRFDSYDDYLVALEKLIVAGKITDDWGIVQTGRLDGYEQALRSQITMHIGGEDEGWVPVDSARVSGYLGPLGSQ